MGCQNIGMRRDGRNQGCDHHHARRSQSTHLGKIRVTSAGRFWPKLGRENENPKVVLNKAGNRCEFQNAGSCFKKHNCVLRSKCENPKVSGFCLTTRKQIVTLFNSSSTRQGGRLWSPKSRSIWVCLKVDWSYSICYVPKTNNQTIQWLKNQWLIISLQILKHLKTFKKTVPLGKTKTVQRTGLGVTSFV